MAEWHVDDVAQDVSQTKTKEAAAEFRHHVVARTTAAALAGASEGTAAQT